MRKGTLGVLLCALLLAWPVAAQEQRASIEGIVRDSQGGVLPGATVTARNVASGGAVIAVADATGRFRFPALSSGRYQVGVELSGFRATTVENIELLLGQIKTIDFALAVAGVTEEVQVTAEAPLVDVRQSARSTNLREELIDLLPKGRDFTTLVTLAPGANYEARSGGISIDGSSASENRYIVDGIETTDLQNGTSGKQVIADFIEEIQIKSSGYTAEYGGATGGVINVITKSGSNNFRGTALYYFQGSALEAGRYTSANSGTPISEFGGSTGAAPLAAGGRDTLRLNPVTNAAEYVRYKEDSYYRMEPGFSVGGPIATNKAWFYAAYQPTMIRYERNVTLATGGDVTKQQKDTRHFLTANQTAQVSDKLRTRAAFNNSWRRLDGLLPSLDGLDPAGTNYGRIRTYPNYSVSGQADWVATPKMYYGIRGGYWMQDVYDQNVTEEPRFLFSGGGNIGMAGVPASLQRGSGFASIPTNSKYEKDKQTRVNFQADGTWYVTGGGNHTIKAGIQLDKVGNDVLQGESRPRVTIRWGQGLSSGRPVQRGTFGYYSVRSNGVNPQKGFITEGNVSTTNVGLFFQDAWTIADRLTINAGVRTERERVPAYASGAEIPEFGIEFGFKDKLAPRLGFAYDVKGDGKWKTYGSWGMFYDIFKLELPRGSFGGDKWLEYYYTLDTPDWPNLVAGASCPPACSGTLIRGPVDFRHPSFGSDAIEPDLKPMRLQEAAVGLEHQLSDVMAASLRYVHKQVDRAIEDTGSLDADGNEIYIIANPGEGLTKIAYPGYDLPVAKRNYDAVELALDKRLANSWSGRVSYMWSRLHGNYPGLSQGDENGRVSPNVGRLFDYPAMMFDQHGQPVFGLLPTDRPHQVKLQGIYSFATGTSVGLNFYMSSGAPVTREIGIFPPNNLPVQYLGRGSDGRTDVYSQADLSVTHDIKFAAGRRAQISFNVLNLFNQAASIGKWSTYHLFNGINIDETKFYAGQLDFATLIQQQGVVQDPRFLKSSFFQSPISARLGFKLLF